MVPDGHPLHESDAEPQVGAAPRGGSPHFLSIEDITAPQPRVTAPATPAPQPAPAGPTATASKPAPTPRPPAAPKPAPTPTPAPQPAPTTADVSPTPSPPPTAPPSAPPSAPPAPEPQISAAGAASQIAELLRAAHDTAARLRQHAEIEVRRTVDAARAEVQAHRQNQMRILDAEQAAAEQLHAEIVHNARLAATELRTRAEQEAAEIRAAAEAVFAQAAAHAHATRALVAHNLAEIEAAKHETMTRSTELISAGRDMVAIIEDLDDTLSEKLAHTDRVLEWANATRALTAS